MFEGQWFKFRGREYSILSIGETYVECSEYTPWNGIISNCVWNKHKLELIWDSVKE